MAQQSSTQQQQKDSQIRHFQGRFTVSLTDKESRRTISYAELHTRPYALFGWRIQPDSASHNSIFLSRKISLATSQPASQQYFPLTRNQPAI